MFKHVTLMSQDSWLIGHYPDHSNILGKCSQELAWFCFGQSAADILHQIIHEFTNFLAKMDLQAMRIFWKSVELFGEYSDCITVAITVDVAESAIEFCRFERALKKLRNVMERQKAVVVSIYKWLQVTKFVDLYQNYLFTYLNELCIS